MAKTVAQLSANERQLRKSYLATAKRRRRDNAIESIDFTDINRSARPVRLSDAELRRRANSRRYVSDQAGEEGKHHSSESKSLDNANELKQALHQALDKANYYIQIKISIKTITTVTSQHYKRN